MCKLKSIQRTSLFPLLAAITIMILLIQTAQTTTGIAETALISNELEKLKKSAEEMQGAGLYTNRMNDLIAEGQAHMELGDFENAEKAISDAKRQKELAYSAMNEINSTGLLLEYITKENNLEQGKENSGNIIVNKSAEWDLSAAKKELERESYEEALKLAQNAKKTLVNGVQQKYNHLKEDILALESKAASLNLPKTRITFLKEQIGDGLANGMIMELKEIDSQMASYDKCMISIETVKKLAQNLQAINISAEQALDTLEQANLDISIGNYQKAINDLEAMDRLAANTIILKERINGFFANVSKERQELGITDESILEVTRLMQAASDEIFKGNYDEALAKSNAAESLYENSKADAIIKKSRETNTQSLLETMRKNLSGIIIAATAIIVLFIIFQKSIAITLRHRRLKKARKELIICDDALKELQRSFFIRKKMSRDSYYQSYERLQKKILRLKDQIELESKRIKNA